MIQFIEKEKQTKFQVFKNMLYEKKKKHALSYLAVGNKTEQSPRRGI